MVHALETITESASKVGELVGEIAAASNEQAQGIEQINMAVGEMDKVVQQNAANTEESASASEEMNARAEQMKAMVNELVALVGGRSKVSGRESYAATMDQRPKTQEAIAGPVKVDSGKGSVIADTNGVDPEEVIPMEDDDLSDF